MTLKHTIALSLAILAMAASSPLLAWTPKELSGKWMSKDYDKDDDIELDGKTFLTIKEDGTFTEEGYCKLKLFLDKDNCFQCDFKYTTLGTYVLDGDKITFTNDPKQSTLVEGNNKMPGIMKALLYKPLVNEMKKSFKKPHSHIIKDLTSESFKMAEPKEKDATPDLYTKVQ